MPEKEPKRLQPIDRNRELLPWRRAYELTRCSLYWIPVTGVPAPAGQRQWLLEFHNRLEALLGKTYGLREEIFLQFKTAMDLMDAFHKTSRDFSPLLGLGRRPGSQIPKLPTEEELNRDLDKYVSGEKQINVKEIIADYSYWFMNKTGKRQRQEFWGFGGMTMLFLKPDPKTAPPEIYFSPQVRQSNPAFQAMDVDAFVAGSFSLLDGFLPKSKELFGKGLEEEAQYPGLQFVLPLLETKDFFQGPEEEAKKWFDLFSVYVNESPADKGVVLASKNDIEEDLIALLRQMREDGLQYPR